MRHIVYSLIQSTADGGWWPRMSRRPWCTQPRRPRNELTLVTQLALGGAAIATVGETGSGGDAATVIDLRENAGRRLVPPTTEAGPMATLTWRFPCGCGLQRGCSYRARASSATEPWQSGTRRPRALCTLRRAAKLRTRMPWFLTGPNFDGGLMEDQRHEMGIDQQFEGARMRLGRLARWTRRAGPLARILSSPRH